jgi:hypothetical protein
MDGLAISHQRDVILALLEECRDLILGRVESTLVAWASTRGWSDYLLRLSDAELNDADALGIAPWFLADGTCPQNLRDLAAQVETLSKLPKWRTPPVREEGDLPGTNPRKQQQIAAVLQVLPRFYPKLSHLVDVGSGRGHLTTQAARKLSVPALGLECNPDRIRVSRLGVGDAPVEFQSTDVLSPHLAPLEKLLPIRNRLLLALHGCGALADALVRAAIRLRAHVLLLACCPQKIPTPTRVPLCEPGLELPRTILGLANVLARTVGIEGPLTEELATKEYRLALRHLFQARGIPVPPGEEMRGLNRRQAHAGFNALAEAAFHQRGMVPPTKSELVTAAASARERYRALRRLSLPRSMLGRLLEVYLALDRASFLYTAGYIVKVVELFPTDVSPRNIAVLGRYPT